MRGLSDYLARQLKVQVVDPMDGRFAAAQKKGIRGTGITRPVWGWQRRLRCGVTAPR